MSSISTAPFHNIKPRTRAERQGMRDREAIQKVRLKQRIGGFHQYQEFQGINRPEQSSHYYLPEAERFDTDFASEDRRRREVDYQRRQEVLNQRREVQVNRDLDRWRGMEAEDSRQQQMLQNRQAKLKAGQKNNPSAAYNPITLEYDQSEQGSQLKYQDDKVRHRAGLRMYNLDQKMNSEFNILTGEVRRPPDVPHHP